MFESGYGQISGNGSAAVSGADASHRIAIRCTLKVYFGASRVPGKYNSLYITS